MATIVGAKEIQSLFLIVFFLILILVPCYSYLVSKLSRVELVPYSYRFFSLFLILFSAFTYNQNEISITLAKTFFVWLSIFNLFVVSIFWSVLSDIFSSDEAKKYFGPISAGGSLGGLASSGLISLFGEQIPTYLYFIIAFILLEFALFSFRKFIKNKEPASNLNKDTLNKDSASKTQNTLKKQKGKSDLFLAFKRVASSRYLAMICIFTVIAKICGTFVYLQLIDFVKNEVPNVTERTQMFATENLVVQIITLFFQFFLTAYILKKFSLKTALSILPVLLGLGFCLFTFEPSLIAAFCLQITSRVLSYGLNSPAGEVLFTVVNKDDVYKTKSLIDTAIKRGGDVLGSKFYSFAINTSIPITTAVITLSSIWALIAYSLGGQQLKKEEENKMG